MNQMMRKKFSLCFFLMVLISACTAFAVSTIHSYFRIAEQVTQLESAAIKSIILDAGHGGEDGGAVGKAELLEKDINLAITLKLKAMLEASGFQVILTREADTFIGDNTLSTLTERKKSDMQTRLQMINDHPESLFVSIHQNHFGNTNLCGAQVFYSPNHENSAVLASSIQNSIVTLLQNDNERQSKAAENTIYLLRNAKTPAVIVECGFLSNATEAKLLCEDTYQNQIAFSIWCGILDYYATV